MTAIAAAILFLALEFDGAIDRHFHGIAAAKKNAPLRAGLELFILIYLAVAFIKDLMP